MRGLNGTTAAIEGAGFLSRTISDTRKSEWPYPWYYCPESGLDFELETATAAPTDYGTANLVELWNFIVPDGEFLAIDRIMLNYVGTGNVDGLGQVTWIWDVNIPTAIGGAVTAPILPNGYVVPYFGGVDTNGMPTGQIIISKGSPQQGPWKLNGKRVFEPRDQVRVKVFTANPFPTTGVFFLTALLGKTYPVGA